MRKALLALLVIPVLGVMPGGIEPANAQPEDRRRATTHPAYKSHHRWGYTYMDWCKGGVSSTNRKRTMMQINRMLSYLGAIRTRAERADDAMREVRPVRQRRACQSCPEWLMLHELSPLFSLIDATSLRGLLDGQGLSRGILI